MSEEARSTAHMDGHLDELRRSVTGAVIAPGRQATTRHAAASMRWSIVARG
jgi:hypothetical protein